ncbi:Cilia- and flagella-associated protein 61 like protein, partial [Aduncisulcus paluster]
MDFDITRIDEKHIESLEKLIKEHSLAAFEGSHLSIEFLRQNCLLSLGLVDGADNVVAALFLSDNTPIFQPQSDQKMILDKEAAGPPDPNNWGEWIAKYYPEELINERNSVFVNYFVTSPIHEPDSVELLRTAFSTMPHIDNILLLLPPGRHEINPSFELLCKPCGSAKLSATHAPINKKNSFELYCIYRDVCLPKVTIRAAKVEDNDDILPLFEMYAPEQLEGVRKYGVAQLVHAHERDENITVLVAEVDGTGPGGKDVVGCVVAVNQLDLRDVSHFHICEEFNYFIPQSYLKTSMTKAGHSPMPGGMGSHFGGGGMMYEDEFAIEHDFNDPRMGGGFPMSSVDGMSQVPLTSALSIAQSEVVPQDETTAFNILLYVMNPEYESEASVFIPPLFASFPHKRHCVITQTRNKVKEQNPFLDLFCAVQPRIFSPDVLYVAC